MKYEKIQRVKYVKLLEILRNESDEDKPLTTIELIDKLRAMNIAIDRKTLYNDLSILNQTGYEIMCNRSSTNEYFIVNRDFDVPELKILMDAVQAAKFISENKTEELLQKIAKLGGRYRQGLLMRDAVCFETDKHSNESVYYSVNEIEHAMNDNKKIKFRYYDFDFKCEKVYRKNGGFYEVNPICTLISQDNYYLVCYSDKYDNVANYRIDRMENVSMLNDYRTPCDLLNNFDKNKYRKQIYGMFNGESETITLEFNDEMIDCIVDKFGEKTKIRKITSNKYSVTVDVIVSEQFFGALAGLGNKIKIVSPDEVAKEYKNFLMNIIEIY